MGWPWMAATSQLEPKGFIWPIFWSWLIPWGSVALNPEPKVPLNEGIRGNYAGSAVQ